MKLASLHEVLVEELRDLYNAENQLLKALPKMAKAASSEELQQAFTDHLEETEGQVERLDRIADQLEIRLKGKTCKAMKGLIEEGQEIIDEEGDPNAKDAALIAAAQKVEHYEIASYGTVRTFAEIMGYTETAELLQQTLEEESAADKKLTEVAMSGLNAEAAEEDEEKESNGRRASPRRTARRR